MAVSQEAMDKMAEMAADSAARGVWVARARVSRTFMRAPRLVLQEVREILGVPEMVDIRVHARLMVAEPLEDPVSED